MQNVMQNQVSHAWRCYAFSLVWIEEYRPRAITAQSLLHSTDQDGPEDTWNKCLTSSFQVYVVAGAGIQRLS